MQEISLLSYSGKFNHKLYKLLRESMLCSMFWFICKSCNMCANIWTIFCALKINQNNVQRTGKVLQITFVMTSLECDKLEER